MRLLRLIVPADEADAVSGRCWLSGAAGIWEVPGAGRWTELRVGVEVPDVPRFLAALADRDPVDISHELLPHPSAQRSSFAFGEHRIDLEVPATVFGDGRHATTATCLKMMASRVERGALVLDVGCGSGALSVAAAKAGAQVTAIDIDAGAVATTANNLAANTVTAVVSETPLEEVEGQFDVVLANVSAGVLLDLATDLQRVTAPAGALIVSGVLESRRVEVLERFAWEVEEAETVDGWVTAVLRR